MVNNDISGEIVIPSHNKMSVKYRIVGQDISDIFSEINIIIGDKSDVLAEISPRVSRNEDKQAEIYIMQGGNSDVLSEIQPIGGNNTLAEIIVSPGNAMSALFEVKEPPRITTTINPSQDSLVRDVSPFDTINYGKNNSLSVGRYQSELYRSYIQFDTSVWTTKHIVTDAKLRLYYIGDFPSNVKLELLTVSKSWSETGITHKNSPLPSKVLSTEYTHNSIQKYIEFELTDITSEWVKRAVVNNGFVIKVADESKNDLINFRSRESTMPPELIVTYFDSRVYSAGRTQVHSELIVAIGRQSDIFAEIEVSSSIGHRETLAELYVHRYEDPVDRDIEAEITVTREQTPAEISVSISDESYITAEISVITQQDSRLDSELIVSNPTLEAELFVAYVSGIESEVTVQRREISERYAEINVTREYVDSEIDVKYKDDVLAEIIVEIFEDSNTPSEVNVTREAIYGEIYVKYSSDTASEITVAKRKESDTLSEITASRDSILTEIYIKGIGQSDVGSEIVVRVLDDSEVLSEINVTKSQVWAEVNVVETSETEAEIYVKHNDDSLAEINVHVYESILAEIDVIKVSEKFAEISVTRTDISVEIMVPYWDDSDILSEVSARVLRVSDILAEIQIGDPVPVGDSYAFII